MENTLSDDAQNPPRRKRRSKGKSSKAKYEQRRRWKRTGLWLLVGLLGGVVVAAIATMAGGSGG
jgi:hypothetical protein